MKEIIETISDELRRIASEAGSYMRAGGRLYLEIGFDQGREVSELLRKHGFINVSVSLKIPPLTDIKELIAVRLVRKLRNAKKKMSCLTGNRLHNSCSPVPYWGGVQDLKQV